MKRSFCTELMVSYVIGIHLTLKLSWSVTFERIQQSIHRSQPKRHRTLKASSSRTEVVVSVSVRSLWKRIWQKSILEYDCWVIPMQSRYIWIKLVMDMEQIFHLQQEIISSCIIYHRLFYKNEVCNFYKNEWVIWSLQSMNRNAVTYRSFGNYFVHSAV